MFRAFCFAFREYLHLYGTAWVAPRHYRPGKWQQRAFVLLAFFPLVFTVQLIHWVAFLLDEVLFPGYRRVNVRKPVFIAGTPRAGTTLLHHTLARHRAFTTFSTWESLFAPAIIEKKLLLGLFRLDYHLGAPLARLISYAEHRLNRYFHAYHPISLRDPEEDFLVLLPVFGCFLLFVPFPHSLPLWRLAFFEELVDTQRRQRILDFYHRCIQKHLFVFGDGQRRFLSKNASFASWLTALHQRYPDAFLITCVREPHQALVSQLASLEQSMLFFGHRWPNSYLTQRLLLMFVTNYQYILTAQQSLPEPRFTVVRLSSLQTDFLTQILQLYQRLDLTPTAEDHHANKAAAQRVRNYRSAGRYSLEDFGIEENIVHEQIRILYQASCHEHGTMQALPTTD